MTALTLPGLPRVRPLAFLAAAILVSLSSYLVAGLHGGTPSDRAARTAAPQSLGVTAADHAVEPPGGPASASASSVTQIDHSIRAWSANLRANDKDFLSATNLGILYHARGRLSGDVADYFRAREALDRALAIVPADPSARTIHALVLQATHDFAGALAEASRLFAEDATRTQALATVGDAQLELGDYGGATKSFEALDAATPSPAVTARLAHLAWLHGRTDRALALARRAHDEAVEAGTTGPTLGWYSYLAGTLELSKGNVAGARGWFDRAAREWPDAYPVIFGLARVAAAEGRTDDAISMYERAIAIAPQPDGLAALGDLHSISGRPELAAQEYATVRAIAQLDAANRQVYNRQLVLFDVDHNQDVGEALRLAESELAVRKDIYGHDAYAWALLANGRAADADRAMAHALALGTRDARLFYHAGMIAKAVGDDTRARNLLSAALAINPRFDPIGAMRARAALAELR